MIILLTLVFVSITIQESSFPCLAEIHNDPHDPKYLSKKGLLAKKGCQDRCGGVWIRYPFGIRGSGHDPCYYDKWYEITCNTSYHPPRPFLSRLKLEVVGSHMHKLGLEIVNVRTKAHNMCLNNGVAVSQDFQGSPFRYSSKYNVFVASGSNGIVVKTKSGDPLTWCAPSCTKSFPADVELLILNSDGPCAYDVGCCLARFGERLPLSDLEYYEINILKYDDDDDDSVLSLHHGCNTTAIYANSDAYNAHDVMKVTTLTWKIPEDLLDDGRHTNFTCGLEGGIHYCYCEPPHVGNPYLPYGCQVDCSTFYRRSHLCRRHHALTLASVLGLSIGISSALLFIFVCWLNQFVRRIIEMKRKSKNFKRNGGLLLQQQISTHQGVINKTKIFTLVELNQATDNFSKNRILGQGGQGTVYKGMMEDGKIVAIKKSKKINEDQLEQFINEVVIVSQINHRNVVKLLGCCLETEVPLLVYEFIPNGTLYHHFHNSSEDFQLTWKMRLQIAADSACALAYLHSSTSPPIYHRDIKSSNILLDDKYRAKVSDFGTSKAISIEQTHVTTCVLGTYGYLDPEYFQSNQFTEKSDVYSFGVVLVELITSKKPICPIKTGGWISLSSEFLFHMENGTLNNILDSQLLEDGKKEEMVVVADLARQCLKMNGRFRPTMKEIATMLDNVRLPYQEMSVQHNYAETDQAISEMNEIHCLSLQDLEVSNSLSIEVQPLTVNNF